jgi:hypothetical protein
MKVVYKEKKGKKERGERKRMNGREVSMMHIKTWRKLRFGVSAENFVI